MLTNKKRSLALSLFDIGAIKFDFKKGWRLKLHEKHPEAPLSPFYIDLRILQSHLEAKKKAVSALMELTKKLEFDLVAGIPLAAVALVSTLADKINTPQITPRMKKKTHGEIKKIDGSYEKGQTVLLIDDLVTRAGSKLEAVKVLKSNGLKVNDVAVIFDRQQGGKQELAEMGYELHSALEVKSTLKFYKERGKITKNQLERLLEYLDNPLG